MSSYHLTPGTDPAGGERIELTDDMLIGRSDDCDLTVQDGHPSRRHARLTIEDGRIWLEDLGSANGTFVNDRQITAKTELHPGDRIAFDLSTFRLATDAVTDDEATVVRSAPAESDATVVRPLPAAEAEPPAPPQPETPAAQPPSSGDAPPGPADRPAPASVPKSWADPDFQAAGTRVLSREELAAMAAGTSTAAAPSDQAQGPHLRVLSGHAAGQVLSLDSDAGEWTIGTDSGRDLELADEGISGYHAKISRDGDRWRIIDQMSANGTWVNDDKVTVSYLGNGDRLRFAQVECEIQVGAGATSGGGTRKSAPGTTGRTWIIAVGAAAITVAVLALVSWL